MTGKHFISGVFAAVIVGTPLFVTAQPVPAPRPEREGGSAAEPARANHELTEALLRAGATSCAPLAETIARFLFGDKPVTVIMANPAGAPDEGMVSAALMPKDPGTENVTTHAEVQLAPGGATGCQGAYQVISFVPQTCAAVEQTGFADAGFQEFGQRGAMVAVLGQGSRVITRDTLHGCISIKNEVVQ